VSTANQHEVGRFDLRWTVGIAEPTILRRFSSCAVNEASETPPGEMDAAAVKATRKVLRHYLRHYLATS